LGSPGIPKAFLISKAAFHKCTLQHYNIYGRCYSYIPPEEITELGIINNEFYLYRNSNVFVHFPGNYKKFQLIFILLKIKKMRLPSVYFHSFTLLFLIFSLEVRHANQIIKGTLGPRIFVVFKESGVNGCPYVPGFVP